MISSERSQNIIIAITIIAAVVSSGFLVSNSNYYTGSYALVGQMNVDIVKTEVSSIDPGNETIFPRIVFTVNLRTTSATEGNVRVNFLGGEATLNGDLLSYTSLARSIPFDNQALYPDYDRNFTLRGVTAASDRDAVIDAYQTDTWQWLVTLRYSFYIFDEYGSITFRFLEYNYTGAVVV